MIGPLRSVSYLAGELGAGRATVGELVSRACDKAKESGPVFITIAKHEALEDSRISERRLREKRPRSDLEGIPYAVKDVIDTARIPTTMASEHFADNVPTIDAKIVQRFRVAGAVLIGKANSHEFSYGIRGDSGANGVVLNPHDSARIAGGSSSGSAAAVARGIVPLALGTDTAGSVRVPGALCGVVGFKPTYGLVPKEGIFPLSPSFDTPGFLGTCIDDILTATRIAEPKLAIVEREGPQPRAIRYASLGQLREEITVKDVGDPFDKVSEHFSSTDIKLPGHGNTPEIFVELYNTIRSREAYIIHKPLIESAPQKYQSQTLARLRSGRNVSQEDALLAEVMIDKICQEYIEAFEGLDILISPTLPIVAPRFDEDSTEVSEQLMRHTVIWNILRWPCVTLPCYLPGVALPQSVQLIAKPGEDLKLLAAAKQVETLLAQVSSIAPVA